MCRDREGRPPGGVLATTSGQLVRARPQALWIGVEANDELRGPGGDSPRQAVAEWLVRQPLFLGHRGDRVYVLLVYLIAFFSDAPALNFGTREAAI
jgi:hypothetical protein